MALIFHFDARGSLEDGNKKQKMIDFREGFCMLLNLLQRGKSSFSIVIHRCKDFDGLNKLLEKDLDPSVQVSKIPNDLGHGFDLLSNLRKMKSKSVLVIQDQNKSETQSPLERKIPSLPFSWYFTFDCGEVEVVDAKGHKVKTEDLPEMMNIYLDFGFKIDSPSDLLFYITRCPIDPTWHMDKYIRPLDSSDIGKTITKLRTIRNPLDYHLLFGLVMRKPGPQVPPDISYCFPGCYVLKDIETIPEQETKCSFCFRSADKMCGKCKNAFYCSQQCQSNHWEMHKKSCEPCAKAPNKVISMTVQNIAKDAKLKVLEERYFYGWGAMEDIPSAQDYANLIQEYNERKVKH